MVDTDKYTIHNIPDSVVREVIEESYLHSFLKTSPTFYLSKMTYEPYSVIPMQKSTMEYEMKKEGTSPSDYREFHYKYKAPEPVQLELFNF